MSSCRSLPAPPAPPPAPPASGNGVHGETGAYLHPAHTPDETLALLQDEPVSPEHLVELHWRKERDARRHLGPMEGVDPGCLAATGWGVVLPAGQDPKIKAALQPLLDLRREQAEGRYKELVYQGDGKPLFLARYGAGPGPVDPRQIPYYLMLVGGPGEIPFDFQYQIDVQYAVGRLCFDGPRHLDDYAQYARSVVAAETRPPRLPRRVALFGPRTAGDLATERTHDRLIQPLARELMERQPNRSPGWNIEPVTGPAATQEQLLALLGRSEASKPALLVTAGHGVGMTPGDPRQPRIQGSLLCQSWQGAGQGISPHDYVSAADVLDTFSPAGLITFHLACYSAATPAANDFVHRGPHELKNLAPAPFIARLPQRLLSHPDGGALAFVGHVDRAWVYSFDWPLAGGQIEVFASAFLRLLNGSPIGWAMEPFNQRYAEMTTDFLTQAHRPAHPEILHPAAFKTALLDARNYVVLGDPAVRLAAAGSHL